MKKYKMGRKMVELWQVYKCNVCGNIVIVTHASYGALVCCGQPMELQKEKTNDMGNEKHVPVIEKIGNKIKVKVGSVPHPMESSHYIEWVELIVDGKHYFKHLKAGDVPEAEFCVENANEVSAREYCNLHGLWKTK